jgi:subtilisin family serine protease
VVVVAAAGNSGSSGNPSMEPASCAGVLAVGAVTPGLSAWPGSEKQPYVAVSAPGTEVAELLANGGNGIGTGTSASAAFVSGEAALVRSRYPSMPWYRVVQRIIDTALPKGSVPNNSYGYGIVRIPGALEVGRVKVAASAPNPVYSAYQGWLASPQGQRFASPSPGRSPAPPRVASSPAGAPPSSGGSGGLAAVIGAVVVIVVAAAALSVVAARRRRQRRV